jgi:hypothetical protein
MAPISWFSLSIGTVRSVRAPANLASGSSGPSVARSATWTTCFVRTSRSRVDASVLLIDGALSLNSAKFCGALWSATRRKGSPSPSNIEPNAASQMRVAFSSMAWNTGFSAPGELEMTCNTSEVAASCSRASSNSRVRVSSFFSNSARGSRTRLMRVLTFVLVERRSPTRVRLFAPLRDKVTSSARLIAPCWSPQAEDRVT